jgi:hypothetical protein
MFFARSFSGTDSNTIILLVILLLKELEMIKVDRCYKPSTFESVNLCQLHCFADASDISSWWLILNIYVKTKFVILYKPVHS